MNNLHINPISFLSARPAWMRDVTALVFDDRIPPGFFGLDDRTKDPKPSYTMKVLVGDDATAAKVREVIDIDANIERLTREAWEPLDLSKWTITKVDELDEEARNALIQAAARRVVLNKAKELKPPPEPPTYATIEEVREAFGAGSPFDPTGKINPNAKPVSFPKVLSALEMCISIAEDELAGTDGYSIVAEAEAELAAMPIS